MGVTQFARGVKVVALAGAASVMLAGMPGCGNGSGNGATNGAAQTSRAAAAASYEIKDPSAIRDSEGNVPQRPRLSPMEIVEHNDVEELLAYLYWERNPNWKDAQGFTMLHAAARAGRYEIARTLIEYGAEVDAIARPGLVNVTPLHWAARANQIQLAELLLDHGADVNARAGVDNDQTPLRVAIDRDFREMAEFIASRGGTL